jgi:hypothetical protein
MLVRAYHRLFGFVLSALDPDRQATVLYPFMGPDMVPAHSRPTIGINLESRDAVIGREVVDAVLSESGDGLLNPNDSLDALEVSSYRFLQEANRSPCSLLLKGFGFHSRGAAGSRVTSKESQISAQVQEVLGYIFANLRDGDTVLALDQNDVDMLSAYGISDASRALALYSFDPRYPLYVEAGFNDDHYQKKTLQMPNALLALKKENGKLTVIPFRGTPNEHNSWSNRDGRGAKGGIDGSASSPSTPGAGKAGGVDSSASSPSTPGAGKAGGVDFRALPIAIQPMPVAGLKPVPLSSIDNARLDAEWQQIERMLNGGIIPSVQRLKEYLVASCGAQDCPKRQEATLSCIADILRIEEDRSSSTDDSLKQLLVLLESGKPSAELQAGLMSIEVISNNPKVPK